MVSGDSGDGAGRGEDHKGHKKTFGGNRYAHVLIVAAVSWVDIDIKIIKLYVVECVSIIPQ